MSDVLSEKKQQAKVFTTKWEGWSLEETQKGLKDMFPTSVWKYMVRKISDHEEIFLGHTNILHNIFFLAKCINHP